MTEDQRPENKSRLTINGRKKKEGTCQREAARQERRRNEKRDGARRKTKRESGKREAATLYFLFARVDVVGGI